MGQYREKFLFQFWFFLQVLGQLGEVGVSDLQGYEESFVFRDVYDGFQVVDFIDQEKVCEGEEQLQGQVVGRVNVLFRLGFMQVQVG